MIVTDRETWDRWNETGEWVLFREGESERCTGCDISPRVHRHHDMPPDEFVEWAKPCEPCGGEGKAGMFCNGTPFPDQAQRCDGKRRIAVAVPAIDGPGTYGPTTSGTLTVGHVVVEWGPWLVVESWVGARANPRKVACVSHNGFLDWRWSSDDLTLVGQYAIGGKVVKP